MNKPDQVDLFKQINSNLIKHLRILAVLLFFGFHMYPKNLHLFYVGVDVFLKVSGYLLIPKMADCLISSKIKPILLFYTNRFRRIYPTFVSALFFILFLTFLLGNYFDTRLLLDTLLPTLLFS